MIELLILIGGTTALGMIALTDDALSVRKHKNFLRLFEEQAQFRTMIGFFVSLLATKPKDWHFEKGLRLKKPFHPELNVLYEEGKEHKDSRTLQLYFKERKIIEYRWMPDGPFIEVRNMHTKLPFLSTQDNVKMERVLTHLHHVHTEFITRMHEKEIVQKETKEERISRQNERLKQKVLTFLDDEPNWNNHLLFLSWGREVDPLSITLTLHCDEIAQYICFYDKMNKQIYSKVVTVDNERVFTDLQPTLDAWCLTQIQKKLRD